MAMAHAALNQAMHGQHDAENMRNLPAFWRAKTSFCLSVMVSTQGRLTADGIFTYSVCDASKGALTCLLRFLEDSMPASGTGTA